MITNGKDRDLNANPAGLPNVGGALRGYFRKMTFTQIVKTVVNFQNVETATQKDFQGTRQPLSAQQLNMKPEGQRAWKWEQIHAEPGLVLNLDDKIVFNGVTYRVMAKNDYKEYGYVEYHIVEDYT